MRVSVRELKNHLSHYLHRLRQGESFIITSRGKPVGELRGLPPKPRDPALAARNRLHALPWIRPGKGGKPRGACPPVTWPRGEKPLSELMLEDRE